MAEKKKKTTKKENDKGLEGELVENELLPFNPLVENPVISVDEENEQKAELVEEVQSLATLNKQVLEAKQRETELIVDNRKLDAAQKLIEGINVVADKALNEETIRQVLNKEDLSPMDFKFMADAMDKMSKTLKDLMNPSIQDAYGNRKRTKIVAEFRNQRGETTRLGVDLDD